MDSDDSLSVSSGDLSPRMTPRTPLLAHGARGRSGLQLTKEEDYRSEIIFLQKVGGELKSRVKYLELELASVQRQHEAAARERDEKHQTILKLLDERHMLKDVHDQSIRELTATIARLEHDLERVHEQQNSSKELERPTATAEGGREELSTLQQLRDDVRMLAAERAKLVMHTETLQREKEQAEGMAGDMRNRAEEAIKLSQEYCAEMVQGKEALEAEKRARTKLQAKMDHREALLERYRRDNGRLMRVLVAAGGAGKVYEQLLHEFEDAEGMIYVPPFGDLRFPSLDPLRSRNEDIQRVAQLYQEPNPSGAPRPLYPKTEAEHWVPVATFALAHEFHRQHAAHYVVPLDAFVDFLSQLNQVWRKRERAREERMRAAYRAKVKDIRRQHNMNTPGQEIRLLQEIRWLKRELLKADRIMGKARPVSAETYFDGAHRILPPPEVGELEESLVSTSGEHFLDYGKEPPRDRSQLGQLGATLVAWLGRSLLDAMDQLMRELLGQGNDHRSRTMDIPRADPNFYGRIMMLHNAFMEKMKGRVSLCRMTMADTVERAIDSAVNLHLSMQAQSNTGELEATGHTQAEDVNSDQDSVNDEYS